jgi:UDP-N-acetyl-D-glucosamine dehydrogenase
LGIDVWEAIEAASSKPFGYMPFTPGPGVGGHCLPIDPSYLSWKVRRTLGRSFRFVELANDVNEHMPDYVVQRLVLALNRMGRSANGCVVLLIGMAYKKNTGDAREAPGTIIARRLAGLGAQVHAADPYLTSDPGSHVSLVEATASEVGLADAVVIVTDHDCFDYEMIRQNAKYVLDTRNRMRGEGVERL